MFPRITSLVFFLFALFYFGFGQRVQVKGSVKDEKGQPVPGASVMLAKAKKGTSTGTTGSFSIQVNRGEVLTITAVGFADTTVTATGRSNIDVVLRQSTNNLGQVVVSGEQNQSLTLTDQIVSEQIIQHALEDYASSQQMGEGVKAYSYNDFKEINGHVREVMEHVTTTTNMGAVNYNGLLPVYHQPLETKGSRYLLSNWSHGLVVNKYDTIVSNPSYLFNFDKVTGDLLLTEDQKNYIQIDKSNVKSFALKGETGGYVFERLALISDHAYFQMISKGEKYAVYKSIKTKLIKANGQSNGLTAVGNDYDEYVDEIVYYFVDIKNKTAKEFELKKKAVKEMVQIEKDKSEKYFADHKRDEVNENFLKGFIAFLNA